LTRDMNDEHNFLECMIDEPDNRVSVKIGNIEFLCGDFLEYEDIFELKPYQRQRKG
jgi:hypothetical protein